MRKIAIASTLIVVSTFVLLYLLFAFFLYQVTEIGPELHYQTSSSVQSNAPSSSSPPSPVVETK